MQLFIRVLGRIQNVVIVVDADERVPGITDLISQLWKQLTQLKLSTVVKLLVVAYQSLKAPLPPLNSDDAIQSTDIEMNLRRLGSTKLCSLGNERNQRILRINQHALKQRRSIPQKIAQVVAY